MEGIGSEVSHKIRAAIKAKLIELGAYIDDELPDYIMVMVANKRSRHQMDEDLQLFLGSNTKTFTAWLHTVLQKLQEVTVANFDSKKEPEEKRSGKRKQSSSEEIIKKDGKSSDEKEKTSKKHNKKHKEGKRLKKSKHKSKDKEKSKHVEKRQMKTDEVENKEKKLEGSEDSTCAYQNPSGGNEGHIEKEANDREQDDSLLKLDDSSGTPFFGSTEKNDKFRRENDGFSGKSTSASQFSEEPIRVENGNEKCKDSEESKFQNKSGLPEDEFNIEPLVPNETGHQVSDEAKDDRSDVQITNITGMTVKAPTRELLKEHDKILSETEENMSRGKRKSADSEESLSPEEIRKQLLLSRAKKKLEQSKLADRMKSNSPDIEILENSAAGRQDEHFSSGRAATVSKRSSQRRDYDKDERSHPASSTNYNSDRLKSSVPVGGRNVSPCKYDCGKNTCDNEAEYRDDQKKNVISISKSLEMEKNLGLKGDNHKKSKSKASNQKKKPVPSRIVSIPEPEAPEISSIVKVKPREYISKEKQANKVLILKAVADAEKSIATVHTRNDSDIDHKKTEGIFTKNLRGKRYEKLAVTLSNVQGSVLDRDKIKRMVSVDSENTNAVDRRTESLQDSETSQGFRPKPELTLKNISNKSEDQFISSKTSAMEKNDKYIHCWLEGVEKAVIDDEIVNPSEMDDFVHEHYSDEGKDEEDVPPKDEDKAKKRPKSEEGHSPPEENVKVRRLGDKTNVGAKASEDDGPQIVVTLDGLTSKAIKDIILRNRDTPNGPLLASTPSKKSEKSRDPKDSRHSEENEKMSKFVYKNNEIVRNASTSRNSENACRNRVSGFEKISERFGRINKTSEVHEYKEKYYEFERERYERKYLKYQGTDKEKHYEKLKDKYASAGESKNKKLIARLSEKFGKVDREFENKKRKYSDEDLRYSYRSRRIERTAERDGKYRKPERKSVRSEKFLEVPSHPSLHQTAPKLFFRVPRLHDSDKFRLTDL